MMIIPGTYEEDFGLQQLIKAHVELWIFQAILGDQHKDGMQRCHAQNASCVQGSGE